MKKKKVLREGSERSTFFIKKTCLVGFQGCGLGQKGMRRDQRPWEERAFGNGKVRSFSKKPQNG
jgi:hypothetical protein